jgi:hypothetical protein
VPEAHSLGEARALPAPPPLALITDPGIRHPLAPSPQRISMTEVSVRPATIDDRPLMERLWLMFRHDMSEFDGLLPNPDGTFRRERLDMAFTDPDWAPYLLTSGERPVGFAFVRGLSCPTSVLNSFFVMR